MIKSSGSKSLSVPVNATTHQNAIVNTITAYVGKTTTRDQTLTALAELEKQVKKSG